MRKILFATNHPAPYIDLCVAELRKSMDVTVIYKAKFSTEKAWKNYKNEDVLLYSDFSFVKKLFLFSKFDLVILCGWELKENIFLGLFLIPIKTKISFFLDHPIIGETKINFIAKFTKKLIMKSVDALLPASQSCADYLVREYGVSESKIYIFPYAHSVIDTNQQLRLNSDRENNLRQGVPIRLFTANRFEKRKGFYVFLNALKLLKETNDLGEFEIFIAGSGDEFDHYKELFFKLDPKINLLGWIENDDYNIHMSMCDVYLHASIFEPFGIPPLDAMERGKSVIFSNGVMSCESIFRDCDFIYEYVMDDSKNLADILINIIKNKNKLYTNSQEIIDLVNKNYPPSLNTRAINSIIES